MYQDVKLSLTTDASGDASATSAETVVGRLVALEIDASDLAAGGDITIKIVNTPGGVDRTIDTLTNFGGSTEFVDIVDDAFDTSNAASGTDVHPFVAGNLNVVVDEGGNAKHCVVVAYIEK